MTDADVVLVLLGGVAAGAINVVVGSGTLITFPVLLAVGYSPVVANVSNTIGLVPGSVAGAWGYRAELAEHGPMRTGRLLVASVVGGVVGSILLLTLPASAFKDIVPGFIAVALVLVLVQPWLSRQLAARGREPSGAGWGTLVGLFLCGVYGGYFGAAQGIVILALLGFVLRESLQHANAIKNVLAGATNLVAGIVFAAVAHVSWEAAAAIAVGATIGGIVGARVGRRLPPLALRVLIVLVGCVAIAKLVV